MQELIEVGTENRQPATVNSFYLIPPNIPGGIIRRPPGPPPATFFIIFCISRNCSRRRFTSLIGRPLPLATRARREPFITSGF
jgi:hypothetical protein